MKLNRFVVFAILVLSSGLTHGQVNRYMVFFKDKPGSSFNTSEPSSFLSQKSIERRLRQNISVTSLDLPVNQNYVQELRNTGANVFFKTRWMNGALVQCNASLIATLQALSFVQSVQLVAPNAKLLNNGRVRYVNQTKEETLIVSETDFQLRMIGITDMHSEGFHGEGVTIAVLDSGFPGVNVTEPFKLLRDDNRINLSASYDFVYNTNDVFRYDSHGTEVLSTIAGYQEGIFTGAAYKANFQLYVTEDVSSEFRIEEYNWLFAAERADSAGVDIISTSLGYTDFDDATMDYKKSDLDGKTAVISRAAQFAADRGILVVCSAGNEGGNTWGTITPPADAKGVLAVANVNVARQRNFTSSFGPSSDGRTKPDLAALGTGVSVIMPGGSHVTATGTSFAAPLISGLLAGLWQRYPDLTNQQLMDVARSTASLSATPDNFVGYGIPNYKAVTNFFDFTPQTEAFEVYPNPFSNTVSIRPKNPGEISSCKVEVLTVQGQVLAQETVEFTWLNATHSFQLQGTIPGVYFIRIWWNNKSHIFKIVKE